MLNRPIKFDLEPDKIFVFRNSMIVSQGHDDKFDKMFFYDVLLRSVIDKYVNVGYMKVKEFYKITPDMTIYTLPPHFSAVEFLQLKRDNLCKYEIVVEISGY